MEKIIITCSARHLSYEFPKRKWYQWIKHDRIALMRLASVGDEALELDMQLRIYENSPEEMFMDGMQNYVCIKDEQQEYICRIHPLYKWEIYQAMLQQYRSLYEFMEHMIVLDNGEEYFPDFLYGLAENRNYLSILTNNPERYGDVLEQIEMDFGLVVMLFSDQKEFIRYLKQMPKDGRAFVIAGEDESADDERKKQIWTGKNKGSLLYHLPKKSLLMDFCQNKMIYNLILKKRMDFTYVSIPIFLDNTVKNRYNSVVNEGITFQVMNKKTVWRRKGNENGRKEKYPDLRRS